MTWITGEYPKKNLKLQENTRDINSFEMEKQILLVLLKQREVKIDNSLFKKIKFKNI